MARETGKQRSQRIQIDYYRRHTDLHTWRTICIAVGLIGAGAYAAYVLASGGGSHTSTGEVAAAHAAFEEDCQQCHKNFTPLNSRGAELNWSLVGLSEADSVAHMESSCQKCHDVGDHYRDTMTASWQLKDQNCASCHSDHQGREFDLTAVAASKCTNCHSQLADGCSGAPKVRGNIAGFDKESHGGFASLVQGDPGKVKFDHHQHMQLGQVDSDSKGAFTLAMLDPADRERYRAQGQQDSDPIQLSCASCHEMDGNPDTSDRLIADSELGRYIAPISFEDHCSACHSMNPGIATPDTAPIPHAAPWNRVELLLKSSLAGARLTSQARAPRDDTQPTPLPGEGLGQPAPGLMLPDPAELQQARSRVEQECRKCHDEEALTDDAIAAARAGTSSPLIPPRWLEHGLYDHGVHRQIDCAFCHSAAYPPADATSSPATDHQTVMIDNIESCTGCHRDAERPTPTELTSQSVSSQLGGMSTWASDNCTMCHRYHTPASGSPPSNRSEGP